MRYQRHFLLINLVCDNTIINNKLHLHHQCLIQMLIIVLACYRRTIPPCGQHSIDHHRDRRSDTHPALFCKSSCDFYLQLTITKHMKSSWCAGLKHRFNSAAHHHQQVCHPRFLHILQSIKSLQN